MVKQHNHGGQQGSCGDLAPPRPPKEAKANTKVTVTTAAAPDFYDQAGAVHQGDAVLQAPQALQAKRNNAYNKLQAPQAPQTVKAHLQGYPKAVKPSPPTRVEHQPPVRVVKPTTTKEGERATNAITISQSGKTNHSGKTSHTVTTSATSATCTNQRDLGASRNIQASYTASRLIFQA